MVAEHEVSKEKDPEIEYYGDTGIESRDAPVPIWLKFNYVFWIIWGIVCFYYFWNGSYGWFDRGYWNELQRAANTVYPFTTTEILDQETPPPE
jgi:hypothetical protein